MSKGGLSSHEKKELKQVPFVMRKFANIFNDNT